MHSEPDSPAGHAARPGSAARPWWRQARYLLLLALAAAVAISVAAEHRPHLLAALPYLILLACPLMHLFMHHGHRSGGNNHDR